MIRPTMADLLDEFDPHGPGEDFPATSAAIVDALAVTGPLLYQCLIWVAHEEYGIIRLYPSRPQGDVLIRSMAPGLAVDTPIPD